MYKLYSMQRSGNSYKVRLALALLNAPYRAIEVDILRGESRTPDFLAMNPSGQVPLLEVAEGRYLAESNAILWYVAGGTSLAPETRVERAEALQWMFFEQHALEPNIGAAYFWLSLVKGGRFPFLTILSMRGDFGEGNPWQFPMGQAVEPVLQAMGVIVLRIEQPEDVIPTVEAALTMTFQGGNAVAVLLTQKLLGAKVF